MQNCRWRESGFQPELEEVFQCEVAGRSLIDADSRIYARVNEVGQEQGLSRSLVFTNGLRFTCNRHLPKISGFRHTACGGNIRQPYKTPTKGSRGKTAGFFPLLLKEIYI